MSSVAALERASSIAREVIGHGRRGMNQAVSAMKSLGGLEKLGTRVATTTSIGVVAGTVSSLSQGYSTRDSLDTGLKWGVMGAAGGIGWHAYKNAGFRQAVKGFGARAMLNARGIEAARPLAEAMVGSNWAKMEAINKEFMEAARNGASMNTSTAASTMQKAAASGFARPYATGAAPGGMVTNLNSQVRAARSAMARDQMAAMAARKSAIIDAAADQRIGVINKGTYKSILKARNQGRISEMPDMGIRAGQGGTSQFYMNRPPPRKTRRGKAGNFRW